MKKGLILLFAVIFCLPVYVLAGAGLEKAPVVSFFDGETVFGNEYVVDVLVAGGYFQMEYSYSGGEIIADRYLPNKLLIKSKSQGILEARVQESNTGKVYPYYFNVDTGDFFVSDPVTSTSGNDLYVHFWLSPLYGFDLKDGDEVEVALRDKNCPGCYRTIARKAIVKKNFDINRPPFGLAIRLKDDEIRYLSSEDNFQPVFDVKINGSVRTVKADKLALTRYRMCTFRESQFDYRGNMKLVGLDCNVITDVNVAVEKLGGFKFVIWGYNEGRWEVYNSGNPKGSSLKNIDFRQGYWTQMILERPKRR